MAKLPSGIVTFLFTDIEGSTRLWEARPREMGASLARHDALLRGAVETAAGTVFKTVGDAFCVAFADPGAAITAAVRGQLTLAAEPWGEVGPLRVRMAVHVGTVEARDGDYAGRPLNRVARLLAAGHGGQILVSQAAADLVADRLPEALTLRGLGEHWLKDLAAPERLFQVVGADLEATFPPLRTGANRRLTVPLPPTPLLGREAEMAAARRFLGFASDGSAATHGGASVVRLLTLTGPGGAGKTRLAIELAHDLADAFADGVTFVSLASMVDPAFVAPEIAVALGIRDPGGASPREALLEELRNRHLLLVLDNVEQVIGAAPLVADLLAGCPRLTVLATCRGPLHLRGEQELAVPPLALPSDAPRPFRGAVDEAPDAIAEALQSPAVRLFAIRAAAGKPGFAVTPDNLGPVVEICRRLDGLPLGIELVAARVRLLSPASLLGRFDRRLDLLAGGARDLPARHQTMRGAIAWSYDLLDPEEQRLFARLAVFVGGAALDAVEAVADPSASFVLDLLASLADKSLIRLHDDGSDEPRVEMLDTIRDFALERLEANGDRAEAAQSHAAWFLTLAETAERLLEGPEQTTWLECLERDQPNVRAAIGWLREAGETERALRLAGALWRFWWLRGDVAEGRSQFDALLQEATTADLAVRAKALNGAGVLAESQGDCAAAELLHTESLALSRELGDPRGIAWSLNNLGVVAIDQGDFDRATTLLEESLAVAEAASDAAGIAAALTDLGPLAHYLGQRDQAVELLHRALVVVRKLGNASQLARVLNNLGTLELERGNYDEAQSFFAESLPLHRIIGDKQGIASNLNNLGEVARGLEEEESAQALYAESHAFAVEAGNRLYAAIALENLAALAVRRNDDRVAEEHYREALPLYHVAGDGLGVAACLTGLAEMARCRNDAVTAARWLGATAAVRTAHDLPPSDEIDEGAIEREARAALGDVAFEAAWQTGRDSPLERVIAEIERATQ